jgi:hypothetical protein
MQVTERSQYLRGVALEMLQKTNLELAEEVALMGSASRGQADEFSDLELCFFLPVIPHEDEQKVLLDTLGVTDIVFNSEPLVDGSIWAAGMQGAVPVDIGWQSFEHQELAIEKVFKGETTDHWLLMSMGGLLNCFSLREGKYLLKWKQELSKYPEDLKLKLINKALETWFYKNTVLNRLASAKRHEMLNFYTMVTGDINQLLRIIFALNNSWEPNWKWALNYVNDLQIKPADLTLKIFQILREEPLQGVDLYYNLVLEVLELTKSVTNVEGQLSNVFEALKETEKVKVGIKS